MENVNLVDLSDREIVEQIRNGDERAFGELVNRYEKKVFFIVKRMLNDDDDALDASQEVFIKLHESLRRFRGDANIYTYIYRVATNVAISFLRKRKVRSVVRLDDVLNTVVSHDDQPEKDSDRKELRELVADAVAALPAQQRQVFVLRFYEELSYEEISRILNRSLGALKANYFHAMKKIGEYLKDAMR
ncbi:MAG: RNA polymerase sigma factor [Candidatus Kryptoniota bacterium]